MNDYYYEIHIDSSSHNALLESFLMDLLNEAIEHRDNHLILHTETTPEIINNALTAYTQTLYELTGESIAFTFDAKKMKNQDWIQSYANSVEPVEIASFYVRPSWHEAKEGVHDIIIDPSLAFGTGHHGTTHVALELVNDYTKAGQTVLDLGCGSGILGIAALKKGAVVDLCDIDDDAMTHAHHNLALNGVKARGSWTGSLYKCEENYDLIVANIVTDILLTLRKDIINHLNPGGKVILSGVLEKYEEKITSAYPLKLVETRKQGEWCAFVYEKEM